MMEQMKLIIINNNYINKCTIMNSIDSILIRCTFLGTTASMQQMLLKH